MLFLPLATLLLYFSREVGAQATSVAWLLKDPTNL